MNNLTRILILVLLVFMVFWAMRVAFRVGIFLLIIAAVIYFLSKVKIKN